METMTKQELDRILALLLKLSYSLPVWMGSERDDISRIRNLCYDLKEKRELR